MIPAASAKESSPSESRSGAHIEVQHDHVFTSTLTPGQTASLTLPVVRVLSAVETESRAMPPLPNSLDVSATLHQNQKGDTYTLLRFTLNDVTTVLKLHQGVEGGGRSRPVQAFWDDLNALAEAKPFSFGCIAILAFILLYGALVGFTMLVCAVMAGL